MHKVDKNAQRCCLTFDFSTQWFGNDLSKHAEAVIQIKRLPPRRSPSFPCRYMEYTTFSIKNIYVQSLILFIYYNNLLRDTIPHEERVNKKTTNYKSCYIGKKSHQNHDHTPLVRMFNIINHISIFYKVVYDRSVRFLWSFLQFSGHKKQQQPSIGWIEHAHKHL